MRKQRTIQEKIEQQMYCFGGGGGDGDGDVGGRTRSSDPNTRIDSRGNTVNFNTGSATGTSTPNYTRSLPNGVEVVDLSRPFQGQENLSNRGRPEVVDLSTQRQSLTTPTVQQGLYDNLAVNLPGLSTGQTVSRPDLGAVSNAMDALNNPTTPQEAMQQALGFGEFGGGRMGLGRGFSVGNVPGGYGIQFDKMFAQGGAVTSGIGSLGLPVRFKSTNS
jgi:hypothetical protein